MHGYDVREALPAVRVPTLVTGRTNEWVPAELMQDLAGRIPDARIELFPGDEHMPWVDGEDIADAILSFIDAPANGRRVDDRALVTLLYTDIVSSTASVARAGDERWRSLITQHEDMTADVVARHGGRLVKTMGDGALALFDRPVQAVRCADAIRVQSADLDVEIRAAVHTGECEVRGEDVSGIAAHLASRVLEHAGADEIVVTGTVRDLTLGAGLHFETRGTFELRDVPGRWELLTVASLHLSDLRSVATAAPERTVSSAQASMKVGDRSLVAAARRVPRLTRPLLSIAGTWRRRPAPEPRPAPLE
jgi:class 3 adenylate cyclase